MRETLNYAHDCRAEAGVTERNRKGRMWVKSERKVRGEWVDQEKEGRLCEASMDDCLLVVCEGEERRERGEHSAL